VDKAVQKGIVKPGRYLLLEFDFSCINCHPNIDKSLDFLKSNINRRLSRFKSEYANDLGQSFASATSGFSENDPVGNLTDLIHAVDHALQDIHERGEENHPLWDVRGVRLSYTTAYLNAF
jgi:hypothetical protein